MLAAPRGTRICRSAKLATLGGASSLQTGVKSTLIEFLFSIFVGLIYLYQKQAGVCILNYAHNQICSKDSCRNQRCQPLHQGQQQERKVFGKLQGNIVDVIEHILGLR